MVVNTILPEKSHLPKNLFLNINQLDALNFIISLFQASTCFEHMCLSPGGQNCIIQCVVTSPYAHTYRIVF